jgi:hypothetical protein
MRLTHWRPRSGRPLLPIAAETSGPVYIGGGRDALNVLASSLYGATSQAVDGALANEAPSGARIEGEVVLEQDGQRLRARPGQAAAPEAPADRLIIDAAHPKPDWRWLSIGPATAVGREGSGAAAQNGEQDRTADTQVSDGAGQVDGWLRSLIEGTAGTPTADELRRELAEIDRLLVEAEEREQALLPLPSRPADKADGPSAGRDERATSSETRAPAPDGAATDSLPDLSVEVRREASVYATAFADLRAEMQAVEADLAAIEATLEDSAEEALRAGHLPEQDSPSPEELSRLAEGLVEIRQAVKDRDEAVAEATAAANTAEVVRHGAVRAQAQRPWYIAQLQPVLLGLSASLVVVGIIQLIRGTPAVGLVSGGAAVIAATLAFLMPSRSTPPTAASEELEARAVRAESDSSRWQIEANRRASIVSRLAGELNLPTDPTETDLGRLAHKLAAWREQREETAGRTHDGEVAKNTTTAAIDRRHHLRNQQVELQSREAAVEASWGAWCREHRVPAWWSAEDVVAGHPADLTLEAPTDPTELRQARQGILDQLGRLYWEADRLAATRWLLERSVRGPNVDATAKASGSATEDADELQRRTSQLVSELRGRRMTLAVDGRGRPVLSDSDDESMPLDQIDDQTQAIVGMCLRVAAAEQAAKGQWPVLVRAPGTNAPPHEASPLALLLGELARHTQVLVVTDAVLSDTAGHPAGERTSDDIDLSTGPTQEPSAAQPMDTNGETAGGDIRVLVTPTE